VPLEAGGACGDAGGGGLRCACLLRSDCGREREEESGQDESKAQAHETI